MFIFAVFIPIVVLGSFLLLYTSNLLTNYHEDLMESDNLRVKTILFEITTQTYNISENISSSAVLRKILIGDYKERNAFLTEANKYTDPDDYMSNYAEIDTIQIYTDNPDIAAYKQYAPTTEEVKGTEWYQKAISQSSVFWVPMVDTDKYGNEYWNLCLVRKIPLVNSDYNSVLVIKISDNYLRTRIENSGYAIMASVDQAGCFYSSMRDFYGKPQNVNIDFEKDYFSYTGNENIEGENYLTSVSTMHLYKSDSKIYITSLDLHAYENIKRILWTCVMILGVAVVLPGILIHLFTDYFTGRVNILREEMHKASTEDYDIIPTFRGQDELSEAFADLQIMVQMIKEKDAKMYKAMINEKELLNEQQVMEFKMLASQINPHFLYNTLESIRMKAFTAGDREVATAIKLLGKSMRYVLENTGTVFTTLDKELDYIETYITIQKLRFGDRVNYSLQVQEKLELGEYRILPLLLQPIVENAILHGLEDKEGSGQISVCVSADEENLHIIIRDNGKGMTEEELEKVRKKLQVENPELKASIGLYNINERIKLCYGKEHGIRIESVLSKGTDIFIDLPLSLAEQE
ncbi:MAG: sensor histidine kinase [Lachnospiraceae bacterium]|nr:sensor histidine kinase [Lachnospiraceae bacterium]